ncbi:hypothetical protein CEXT_590671 [Caerostris extrusa]|uniref:Uncharacterized protein n=1 Tax=Caerostris extrusa TaxID=172846 RepID=A0AAV4XFI2_CAEEX|nr:hypothetical protein CEXT_590671 [Caerostris extrusa]
MNLQIFPLLWLKASNLLNVTLVTKVSKIPLCRLRPHIFEIEFLGMKQDEVANAETPPLLLKAANLLNTPLLGNAVIFQNVANSLHVAHRQITEILPLLKTIRLRNAISKLIISEITSIR